MGLREHLRASGSKLVSTPGRCQRRWHFSSSQPAPAPEAPRDSRATRRPTPLGPLRAGQAVRPPRAPRRAWGARRPRTARPPRPASRLATPSVARPPSRRAPRWVDRPRAAGVTRAEAAPKVWVELAEARVARPGALAAWVMAAIPEGAWVPAAILRTGTEGRVVHITSNTAPTWDD